MVSETPELTIVTALYNRIDLTRSFLGDLEKTLEGISYEIILVDDGSDDGTREYLRGLQRPGITCLLNEKNLGFAGSNNRGVKAARAKTVALLNNDLVLSPGWCRPMLTALGEDTGFVGNVQINAQTNRIDHAGIVFTPWGIPEHWGQNYLRIPASGIRSFRAVTAACAMIRKEVFEKEGGFDESYRNGFEDIDLCLRLEQAGKSNCVVFESRVKHWISSSPGRKKSDMENITRFLEKWGDRTEKWGMDDWASHYLRRNMRRPWKLNGRKTLNALAMLSGLRSSRPDWMERRARSLRKTGLPDG